MTGVIITVSDTVLRLWLNDTMCYLRLAILYSNFLGISLKEETFAVEEKGSYDIPSVPIIFILACLMYLTASLIWYWKRRSIRTIKVAPLVEVGAYYQQPQKESSTEISIQQPLEVPQALMSVTDTTTTHPNAQEISHSLPNQLTSGRQIGTIQVASAPIHSEEGQDSGTSSLIHMEKSKSQEENSRKIFVLSASPQSAEDIEKSHQDCNEDGVVQLNIEPSRSNLEQQPNTTPRKIFNLLSLGGFISGIGITCIVLYFRAVDPRIKSSRLLLNLFSLILKLMPVYWMENIPEAKTLMVRKIKNLITF